MELLLDTTDSIDDSSGLQIFNWDISVTDGIADTVPEGAEKDQEANIITFLEKNTIPLMEDKGIDWTGYLLKQHSLSEIDSEVRKNLKTYLETLLYTPIYAAKDGKLTVNLAKIVINSGATI